MIAPELLPLPKDPELNFHSPVIVTRLLSKPELNGQHAVIIGWHGGKGRHPCKMVVDGTELMIKPTNLQLIHEEPQPLN